MLFGWGGGANAGAYVLAWHLNRSAAAEILFTLKPNWDPGLSLPAISEEAQLLLRKQKCWFATGNALPDLK